eukprot:CAMPEP_0204822578 /NCGR_PEP_ID=MMETSP1346-20131115/769_1 /ASSEMBLY_ACC=CAM_ASM_000771 /TAXON_ID=215587 /ORGANISM="Aplanochytrium stocchinoi, Strain GSBS06" /LENGTH=486 /DNA_ID=CAMNT_0051948861 /DNA_START=283 /DNA_END=1743 /DNA_ORIENTATION=-
MRSASMYKSFGSDGTNLRRRRGAVCSSLVVPSPVSNFTALAELHEEVCTSIKEDTSYLTVNSIMVSGPGRRRLRSPSRPNKTKLSNTQTIGRRRSFGNILSPLQNGLRRASMIATSLTKQDSQENGFLHNQENMILSANSLSLLGNREYTLQDELINSCDNSVLLNNSAFHIEMGMTPERLRTHAGLLSFSPFDRSEDELQTLVAAMLVNVYPFASDINSYLVINNLVDKVRRLYEENPYHCFRHACDVTQAMYTLLQNENVSSRLDPLDPLILLLTCLVHDVGHTGFSNNVLRRSNDEMVKRFGSESTLERYHVSLAKEVLTESPVLLYLPTSERKRVMNTMEELVLFTDMETHYAFLEELKLAHNNGENFDLNQNARYKLLFLGLLVKICDVSNVARPQNDAEAWSLRCADEMADLYKTSQALGLEPSLPQPVPSERKRLIGTVHFALKFVTPMYEMLETLCPSAAETFAKGLEMNIKNWQREN